MADATATAPVTAPTSTSAIKPGLKTSEGQLAFAATFLTGLFGAGVIPTTGPVQLVAVIAGIALTSLGYSVSRAMVKAAS